MIKLETVLWFGKYKGKTVNDVINEQEDSQYLLWANNNITWFNLDKDVKQVVEENVKKQEKEFVGSDWSYTDKCLY